MRTLANSEDPDEMPQYYWHAVFHQAGLLSLLKQKQSSEKEIYFLIGNYYLCPPPPHYIQCYVLSLLYQTPEGRVH